MPRCQVGPTASARDAQLQLIGQIGRSRAADICTSSLFRAVRNESWFAMAVAVSLHHVTSTVALPPVYSSLFEKIVCVYGRTRARAQETCSLTRVVVNSSL